jgi:hypothetical protein
MKDEDSAVLSAQLDEAALELVALRDVDRSVRGDGWSDRRQLDLDGSPATPPGEIETSIHGEPVQPGVESVRIAEPGQVAPRPDVRFLHGITSEVVIAKDEPGHRLESRDRTAQEHGEGVVVASPRSLDEFSLAHCTLAGAPADASKTTGVGTSRSIPLR